MLRFRELISLVFVIFIALIYECWIVLVTYVNILNIGQLTMVAKW